VLERIQTTSYERDFLQEDQKNRRARIWGFRAAAGPDCLLVARWKRGEASKPSDLL